MSIAIVIVFWTPAEIMGRINMFKEIWIEPMAYVTEMTIILTTFIFLAAYLLIKLRNLQ